LLAQKKKPRRTVKEKKGLIAIAAQAVNAGARSAELIDASTAVTAGTPSV